MARKDNAKISEALLRFTAPILQTFEGEPTPEKIRPAFMLAITVWNAVILDESEKATDFVEQARRRLETAPQLELFEALVRRKKTEFADDRRLIGDFEVYKEGEEFRLRATAHKAPARR